VSPATRAAEEVADAVLTTEHNLVVPRISTFYGIVVAMFYDEERHSGRPHFHATYAGEDVSIDIATLEVLAGSFPTAGLRLVTEWAAMHRAALEANWERARRHEPLEKIEPLR
jgi:hypothetical protein